MDIETIAHFVGPNIFCQTPLVHFRLSGTGKLPRTDLDSDRRDLLLHLFPGLATVPETCGEAELFSSTNADRRFPINHAIEHIAIELQNQGGAELSCFRASIARPIRARSVLVPFEEVELCDLAAHLACDLVDRLANVESASDESIAPEFKRRINAFVKTARRRMLPVQDRAFVRAAHDRDVPTHRIAGRIIQLGQGCHQKRVSATKTTLTNVVSNDLAANKDFARRVLKGIGLPLPRNERVYRSQDAVAAARRLGFPVVVKPNQGNMGHAVSVGMRNAAEVRAAYKRAREIDRSVLVEEVVEGEDFRVLVIDGRFCAASKRTPGHVVGDGVSTIEQLVETLNADPRRGSGPRSPWTSLRLDDQADRLLADLGLSRTSVPPEGETIFLRRNANTSDGGTAMDVTDDIHPDNRDIAERAARAIGLDIAGVDFLMKDIGRSMWRSGGAICEINSRPGLRKHMWPANGPARDIMTPIVDMLYPKGEPSRVPIIGVLGIDKRTARSTTRLLAYLLESDGRRVGLAVSHQVHIGGRRSRTGRLSAPEAARMILLDPDVDVAVLEFTVNEVVRDGLGCDAFDLSLIVPKRADIQTAAAETDDIDDIDEDRLPRKVRDAIRVVAQTTRSALISEEHDALSKALRSEPNEAELVAVKIENADPQRETADADGSMLLEEEQIRAQTLASQAAIRLGVSRRAIRRALRRFDPATGRRRKHTR